MIYFCLAPIGIGPGAYIKDKAEPTKGRQKKEVSFGTDQRFKMSEDLKELPGPGNYKDQNKWNKRTYNLKFLNNQTSMQANKILPFGKNLGAAKQELPTTSLAID